MIATQTPQLAINGMRSLFPRNTDPRTLGANCAECPFAKEGRPRHLPVYGVVPANSPAKAAVYGEGPGNDEVQTGIPFIGATGEKLNYALRKCAGIERTDTVIINAHVCKPVNKNEQTMAKATQCCNPVFKAQIAAANAESLPTLTMGKFAWKAFSHKLPKGELIKGRGFVRSIAGKRQHIATWHPSNAYFHNPYNRGEFELDMARLGRLVRGQLRPAPSPLIVEPTLADIRRLISESPYIGADIETAPLHKSMPWTGKQPGFAQLRTIGLGNTHWGLSFRWETAHPVIQAEVKRIIASPKVKTIWQNGRWFDLPVLRRYGFEFGDPEDCRDLRKVQSATSPLSLSYMSCLYDDPDPWKEADEDDEKGLVFTEDYEKLCRYNAQDACEQARVWEGLITEPEYATDRCKRLYAMQLELSDTAAEMHETGFEVNYWGRLVLSIGLHELYLERCDKLYNKVGIDPPGTVLEDRKFKANPDCMRSLIFKRHETEDIHRFGLPDPINEDMWSDDDMTTISVGQKALITLQTMAICPQELYDIIELYWQAYAVRQVRSTFVVSNDVDEALGPDGRLRAGWNSCGPDTYRWSCSSPNLMNVSEEKKDG